MAAEERAHAVVDPIIEELDLELVDLGLHAGGRLKIIIDHPDGLGTRGADQGDSHDQPRDRSARANQRRVHPRSLEPPASSAISARLAHYVRSMGEQVAVKLKPNAENLRRIKGELIASDDDGITITNDDG